MLPTSLVGRTACTLSVALTILAILHFYWAFGGTWGLAAALGRQHIDPSHGLRVAAGADVVARADRQVVVGARAVVLVGDDDERE